MNQELKEEIWTVFFEFLSGLLPAGNDLSNYTKLELWHCD
jgi:hypothetical protein